MSKRVGIVGAGLSGLACALELKKQGFEVDLYEKSGAVGGRVKTEDFEGFLLDEGFQVYLPSYEMGKYFFDHEKLELKSFSAGAKVYSDGKFSSLSDPLREPGTLLETLSNSLGTLKDKLLILKLKLKAARRKDIDSEGKTTLEYLQRFGFSQKFILNFFNPFFSGIFLETELKTSSSFFLYLFNKFSTAEASLPKNGMGALAKQLASSIGSDSIYLNSEVVNVSEKKLKVQNGLNKDYDYIVVATTPQATNKILGTSFKTDFNSTQTYYYKTKSSKFSSKKLFLNSGKKRCVNQVACLSAVSPAYSPEGWSLFSVTTVGSRDYSLIEVQADLEKIFGESEINTWQHLKTHQIKYALPASPLYSKTVLKKDGVYVCGDFTASPSIQGALSSGYQVAKEISKL